MFESLLIGVGQWSVLFGGNEAVGRLEVTFIVWCFGEVIETSLTDIVAFWSSLHKDLTIQIPANYVLIRSTVYLARLMLRNGSSTHLIILPSIERKRLHKILLCRAKSIF